MIIYQTGPRAMFQTLIVGWEHTSLLQALLALSCNQVLSWFNLENS